MDLSNLAQTHKDHYTSLAKLYGSDAQGVQYPDREGQWARYRVLAEVGIQTDSSVGDFGCGPGEFLNFLSQELGYEGPYRGVDIVPEHLASGAERFPDATFEERDIASSGFGEVVDYMVVAGVFNNRFPGTEPEAYMKEILLKLMPFAKKGLAFNALSTYVDYKDENLFYSNPEDIFRFCKENLSNLVSLRHDYHLKPEVPAYEYTVYVYPSDVHVRQRNDL